MTNAEYQSYYAAARKAWPEVQVSTLKEIRTVYLQAADEAAALVRKTEAAGLSSLTSESWRAIEKQLRDGAAAISRTVEGKAPDAITQAYFLTERTPGPGRIDALYLSEAAEAAGLGTVITPAGLSNIYRGVNSRLITAVTTREWADGYSFSERVWGGLNQQYQDDIKRIIQAGVAQGRDVTQIARDIEVYARNGREYTFSAGRYGELLPGTSEYSRRVGRTIDYRALRLIRSELYAGMQTAAAWQGQTNPACQNQYDWFLNPARQQWPCDCEDYAAGGPYTLEELPGYPHPNCQCIVRPRLMSHDEFMADLTAWADGESVPYLDDWYTGVYLASG